MSVANNDPSGAIILDPYKGTSWEQGIDEATRQERRIAERQKAAIGLTEVAQAIPGQYSVAARQAAADALASGLSAGRVTGGAALAAGQQAALDTQGKIASNMADLQLQAAQAAYESTLPENDPGSIESASTDRVAEFAATLPTDFSGDEEVFFDDRLNVISLEPDKKTRAAMGAKLASWYKSQVVYMGWPAMTNEEMWAKIRIVVNG